MNQMSFENHEGIPVFKCSQCGCCNGIETENVFAANRGCCFYFPKYTLFDLRTVAAIDPDQTEFFTPGKPLGRAATGALRHLARELPA